ncbi:integrating conjugative element protein [Kosakonia cowanii]|nr:integrating conjugative element protein [Kosakonia cowanii]
MKNHLLAVIPALFISITAFASPLTVVGDPGGESTAPYFEGINNQGADTQALNLPPVTTWSASDALQAVFPVVTPELSPGSVADRPLNAPGMQPLFIVGDDAESLAWLKENHAKLVALNATGLVVNVNNQQDFTALSQKTEGLTLLPVSGSDLSRRLKLSHYPVLITSTGLTQQVPSENSVTSLFE